MRKTTLLTRLTHGTVEERLRAATELGEYRDAIVVAALAEALRDRSYRVRWSAVDALGAIGGPQATAAVVRALNDRDSDVRMRAIENLGSLGGEAAVEPLIGLLRQTTDPLIRVCIVDSMWEIADQRFATRLQECLTDDDELVRGHAAAALGRIGTAETIPTLEAALEGESSAQAQLGLHGALVVLGRQESLRPLEALLANQSYQVRCAAANTLGEVASNGNRALVINMLSHALEGETTIAARASIERNLVALRSSVRAAAEFEP